MKILIVKLSSIGDVVHTLPALAAIKRAMPSAEISWAVERGAAEILRGNSLLERLIEIDTRALRRKNRIGETFDAARRQFADLRATVFDVALDFQGLLKSASIARLARARRLFGFSKENLREPASRFLLSGSFETEKRIHIISKNLALAEKALDITIADGALEFPIFTEMEHKREAEAIIEKSGENFAILNPAGGWATKLWHAEKFGALADKLWEETGLTSVITTAPNEAHLARKVLENSKSGRVSAVEPSLKGFYELAKRARIYVGGDTAPTHLAAAASAPIVGIFGATEWWRNGSPNENDICVERTDIDCRADCHKRSCGNWICMDIEVGTVARAVRKRLEMESGKWKMEN